MADLRQGDKVVVVNGEFRGKVLVVGRVYPDPVELQTLSGGRWVDFCSVAPAELARLVRPL